jgi:PleD family two-component response regulator
VLYYGQYPPAFNRYWTPEEPYRKALFMPARILVVNETQNVLHLLGGILKEAGYEVEVRLVDDICPADVAALRPDLLIVDYLVGDTEPGRRLAGELRQCPATASVPILAVTPATPVLLKRRGALEEQGVLLLLKPFSWTDFLRAVEDALRERPVQQGNRDLTV